MFENYLLQLVNFVYVMILSIVYFTKRKYNFLESKIYKLLLIVTMLIIVFDIASITMVDLISIFSKLYCTGVYIWIILFIAYTLLNESIKKYDSLKNVLKERHSAYVGIVISIVLLIIVVFLQYRYPIAKVTYGVLAMNVTYIAGIIGSVYIMLTLLFGTKQLATYKKWPIFISITILTLATFAQLFNDKVSIIISGLSLIVLFQYFTIENPDLKYIDELNALKIKAEKANQAKTDFLKSMSHEIRTPMNVIIGLSETLLSNNIPSAIKDDVKVINESGNFLLEIVNNFLDITIMESDNLKLNNSTYSIADTISSVSQMVKNSLMDKPIQFSTEVVGYLPTSVMGDESKVHKILMNVLSNSIKYTKKGSVRFIVESTMFGNKNILTFKISDTGIGIKKSDNAKLFEKFERLDQEKTDTQGTGLGLAITKRYVDLMGGKISYESVYQEGTTFTIVIEQEIVDKTAIDFSTYKGRKISVNRYFDGSKYKILLVDDNVLNLKVAEKLLQKYNFNITSVKSGLECINYTRSNNYDLIFMDYMMPEMDGSTTLYNLKKRASGFDTPVVVLTANAIEGSKQKYLREGFCDYLPKPINKAELDRILREQLGITTDEFF